MAIVDDNSIADLPIPDLERRKFYDDGTNSYVRIIDTNGEINGVIDENNSSHTPLAADATFTGTPTSILPYSIIYVTVFSDQASATDGLVVEQGHENGGYHWDSSDSFTIPANSGKTFSIQAAMEYLRISYTNGGTIQGAFRLHVVLKKGNGLSSSHRIQDAIIDDDDATLTKSVLTAKKDSGTFDNIGSTNSGNLRVTDAENGLAIAKGDVTNTAFIHKFGGTPDFDTTDNEVTVWDGADDGNIDKMVYTYSSTADIDTISSSDAGDTVDIEVQGLDSNFDLVTQTATLNGQNKVTLGTALIRVFRMKNVGATDLAGYVYCYVDTTISAGVPTTTAPVRSVIQNSNNQTLMAVYTIPNGKTGYMRDWYASTAGASKSSNYVIRLKARPTGKVFQLKHIASISDTGNSYIQHKYEEPEVFAAKTDIEMTAQMTAAGATAAAVSAGFDIVLVDN